MNVLHLIDPHSPGGGACTLRLLAEVLHRLQSVEQDVLIIGNRSHADLARRCGVEPDGVICPPARQALLVKRALARTLRRREGAGRTYDLVHAWTPQSAMLAIMAAPEKKRLATLSVGPVGGFTTQLFKMLLEQHTTPLIAASEAVAREFRSMGLNAGVLSQLSVLPPAVNPESVDNDKRSTLRRRWEVGQSSFVIGLLSEPASWADVRSAVNVAIRVATTGRDVRLLLHHGAARRADAERWAAGLDLRNLMIIDDAVAEPWRVIQGLDAALLLGGELNSMDLSDAGSPFAVLTGGGRRLRPMPGVMPLLWAMSAGVPVIAEASDATNEIVHDGHSGLLVDQHDLNAAADRIVRLYDDPTIAGRIGMQARSLIQRRFHISAYCVRLKEIYQRIAEDRTVRAVGETNEALIECREHRTREWKNAEEVDETRVRQ